MPLTSSYTQAYGKLGDFFEKIRDGQAPPHFTHALLKDLGFKSNSHRAFIPLMKAIGFLSPDGKPTQRYSDYRDHSRSKKIMGESLKEAYSDIFLIKENPTESDKKVIQGKFKSYHNTSDRMAREMTSTFFSLLDLADLSDSALKKPKIKGKATDNVDEKESVDHPPKYPQNNLATGLHYNIQVHLPATKDIEVYNAIFKSLKEHLY